MCFRLVVITERVQGCVGSQLSLKCPARKVINITAIVLGDTDCFGATCCIKDNDCTRDANADHVSDVHSRCDGQSNCTVDVIQEWITCGYLNLPSNNDFERITYNCIDDPRSKSSDAMITN